MNIILPPHKKQSVPVKEMTDEIKKDIDEMKILINKNEFTNGQKGYAVAHCQVSKNPLRIFVCVDGLFDGTVVINPKILEKSELFTAVESCLSFPFRKGIKVKRFNRIKVSYYNENMEEITTELTGILSQIFQHEIQHFNGGNIYQ